MMSPNGTALAKNSLRMATLIRCISRWKTSFGWASAVCDCAAASGSQVVEEPNALRDQTVRQRVRQLEERVAGEVVAEFRHDLRLRSLLLDDLDVIEILQNEEVDALERLRNAA